MIKRFLIILPILCGKQALAQDDIDALRYSQNSFYGDSRFMSMGGAFGALGANLSCMNFNPAGIAVYRSGEFSITPGIRIQNTKAMHYDSTDTDFSTKLNFSNVGFVSAWDQKNPYPASSKLYSEWNQRNAFGISWNRLSDYNFSTNISGVNPGDSSMIDDFVLSANGFYPSQLSGTYEWLAYQTYLINPESSTDTSHYWGMNLPNTHLRQTKTMTQKGRTGELAFSFAHAFDDKLYVGATLGIPMIKYTRSSEYTEYDHKNSIYPFKSMKYEEQLVTSGNGYNLKAGIIYRMGSVRLGAYAHTPSIIKLTDNYEYKMQALYDSAITSLGDKYNASYDGFFKYRMYTPARLGGSIAYIHKKLLATNVDVEYVAYSAARFKDDDGFLNPVNLTIQKKYGAGINIRAGAELNLNPVVIRAGYALYGSPFGDLGGKFSRSTYSGGLGFKGKKNTYFDMGVIYTVWDEDYYLYNPNLVKATKLHNSTIYLTFSFGVRFN